MFIDEQTVTNYKELHDDMQDFIVDTAAVMSPVYCQGTLIEYQIELRQWDDVLKALVFV